MSEGGNVAAGKGVFSGVGKRYGGFVEFGIIFAVDVDFEVVAAGRGRYFRRFGRIFYNRPADVKLVIADQNGGNGDKERSGRTGEEVPQGAHGFGLPVINATRVHVCFSFPAL